jgi:hypothetical protein
VKQEIRTATLQTLRGRKNTLPPQSENSNSKYEKERGNLFYEILYNSEIDEV